jgi:undecaprenyl-diphosphatase
MDILIAIFLGIVEGLTEFLPVSSTGHLIALDTFLGVSDPGGAFKIMIQLGAILAIVILYFRKIAEVVTGLPTRAEARRFAAMIALAFVPAAIAGFLLSDFITGVLFESPEVVATSLIIGGIVMILVEWRRPVPTVTEVDDIPIRRAFLIGCCQAVALIPGVSRSGATIVGAMLLGVDRRAAAEFSFFLAMPTMGAAFAFAAWRQRDSFTPEQLGIIGVGFVAAFLAALVVVRPFLAIVTRYGFFPFAIYRIVLGGLIFALLAAGVGAA